MVLFVVGHDGEGPYDVITVWGQCPMRCEYYVKLRSRYDYTCMRTYEHVQLNYGVALCRN